jgi:hypothetical protein
MEEDGNLTYSAEIDTTGRFRLEAPPGNYLLGIDLGELGRASRRVTLEAGRTEAIEVPLSPCGRIKGRVSHARSQPYRDS